MKWKKFALIVLMTCSWLISSSIPALGNNFSLDVSEGDDFIWRVETHDEETYRKYFSQKSEFNETFLKKREITTIQDKGSYWKVSQDVWGYTDDEEQLIEKPWENQSMRIYKDPKKQANRTLTLQSVLDMWLIPTPYVNYLQEFRDHLEVPILNVVVEGSGMIIKYAFGFINYEVELAYTVNGVLEEIEYREIDTGDVFTKISLLQENNIPGYQGIEYLVLMLGLISLYRWRKKLTSRKG